MFNSADILAKVVARVESSGFPYAMRFEPAVYSGRKFYPPTLEAAQDANHCSLETAKVICSTSYGLFQIMGFNLYGPLNVKSPVVLFCYDPEVQMQAFYLFCKLDNIDPETFDFSDATLERFARMYNGPGDVPNYVSKLKAALTQVNAEYQPASPT